MQTTPLTAEQREASATSTSPLADDDITDQRLPPAKGSAPPPSTLPSSHPSLPVAAITPSPHKPESSCPIVAAAVCVSLVNTSGVASSVVLYTDKRGPWDTIA